MRRATIVGRLGAGVVHTMAADAPNVPCNFTTAVDLIDTTCDEFIPPG